LPIGNLIVSSARQCRSVIQDNGPAPKVFPRLGQTEGAVRIGGGNLKSGSWGGNKELSCAWIFGPNHEDKGAWLQGFLDEVINLCASVLEKETVLRMKDLPWLAMNVEDLLPPLLYSGGNRALAPALARRWAGTELRRLGTARSPASNPESPSSHQCALVRPSAAAERTSACTACDPASASKVSSSVRIHW
jgi:hypothetical protein